jgi:hypothetical protein
VEHHVADDDRQQATGPELVVEAEGQQGGTIEGLRSRNDAYEDDASKMMWTE